MAQAESRTLELVAKVRDQISSTAKKMGTALRLAFVKPLQAMSSLGKKLLSLKSAFVGIVAAIAARAGAQAFDQVIRSVDELGKLAPTVNDTVENVSRLAFAFQDAGFKGEFLQTMMTALARQSAFAIRNNEQMVRAFGKLGVTVSDLKELGATDLFRKMAKGLEETGTTAEKSAALQQIFADNFRKLLVVLGKGSVEFERMLKSGEAFGAMVTGAEAVAAANYTNVLLKLQTAMSKVVRVILTELGPKVLPLLEKFAKLIATSGPAIAKGFVVLFGVIRELAFGVAEVLTAIVRAIEAWPSIFGKLPMVLGTATAKMSGDMRALQKEIDGVTEKLSRLQSTKTLFSLFDRGGSRLAKVNDEMAALSSKLSDLGGAMAQMQRDAGATPLSQFLSAQIQALRNQIAQAEAAMREAQNAGGSKGKQGGATAFPEPPKSAWDRFFETISEGTLTAAKEFTKFSNVAVEVSKIVQRSLDRLSDTLVDIIVDAKDAREAFRQLAQAILRDLAKLVVKYIVLSIVKSFAGLAQGGVTGGVSKTIPVKSYAKGGVARQPQIAVFGEAGEEAFVPLSGGKIPVSLSGGGGGGSSNVNVFISAMDGPSVRRVLTNNADMIWALVGRGAQGGSRSLTQTVRGRR